MYCTVRTRFSFTGYPRMVLAGTTPQMHGSRPLARYTDSTRFMSYLGIALQNAYHELLCGASFDTSLVNVIKRGGETAVNAGVAGEQA